MIGMIVIAHNYIAREMLAAAENILGEQPLLSILNVEDSDKPDLVREQLAELIRRNDTGSGVFILADMFGGTPCNIAISKAEPGKVEIMSGFNLPGLIKALTVRKQISDVRELARTVQLAGRQYIRLASDYLAEGQNGSSHE